MEIIFNITVAKDIGEASSNEDAFDYDYEKQVFALSDGASESYNSKVWAEILVREFVDSHHISREWILKCIKKYLTSLDLSSLTASQFIAFNKGSFATMIAVERKDNKLNILNVGDSHIFVFTKENDSTLTKNLKYIEFFEKPVFKDNPTLISTNIVNNAFLDFDNIKQSKYFKTLDLKKDFNNYNEFHKGIALKVREKPDKLIFTKEKDTYLICATDAVSEWIFKYIEEEKTEKIFNFLLSLKEEKNNRKFERTVALCRRLKSMNIDDSTLVILKCVYDYGLS